jgi:hypothetical protein
MRRIEIKDKQRLWVHRFALGCDDKWWILGQPEKEREPRLFLFADWSPNMTKAQKIRDVSILDSFVGMVADRKRTHMLVLTATRGIYLFDVDGQLIQGKKPFVDPPSHLYNATDIAISARGDQVYVAHVGNKIVVYTAIYNTWKKNEWCDWQRRTTIMFPCRITGMCAAYDSGVWIRQKNVLQTIEHWSSSDLSWEKKSSLVVQFGDKVFASPCFAVDRRGYVYESNQDDRINITDATGQWVTHIVRQGALQQVVDNVVLDDEQDMVHVLGKHNGQTVIESYAFVC